MTVPPPLIADVQLPSDPNLLLREAQRLFGNEKFGEARAIYRHLERNHRPHAIVLNRLGDIACKVRDWEAAEKWFLKSLALAPDQPVVLSNLGLAIQHTGRYEHALACYEQSISLDPQGARALTNRGLLLTEVGRYDEALASYDSAIAARPDFAGARMGKAETLLLMGDYLAGWELYESRWKTKYKTPNRLVVDFPAWSGEESVSGKSVLVHPEWGFGDFLMLARYIPLLQRRGAQVVVQSPPALASLLRQMDGAQIVEVSQPLPQVDFQCPIMSLPRAFKTTIDTIPTDMPYLRVPPGAQESWRRKLGKPDRRRVGLMWSGTGNRNIDASVAKCRSLPLELLRPLVDLPIEFHSLQKEIPDSDAATLSSLGQIVQHHEELLDFSDTAALVAEMDLVISIDTSVAHLAGALATPLWVMLPYAGDYRWRGDGASTPWYPEARLFRQSSPGVWQGVVQSVVDALIEWTQAHSPLDGVQ